jgi:hypothetical protein
MIPRTTLLVSTAILLVMPALIAPERAEAGSCIAEDSGDEASCSFDCPGEQHVMHLVVAANDEDADVSGSANCRIPTSCTGEYRCAANGMGGPDSDGGTCEGFVNELINDGVTVDCYTSACDPTGASAPAEADAPAAELDGVVTLVCSGKGRDEASTSATIRLIHDAATGEVCRLRVCAKVVPLCVVGRGVACGIGTTVERLEALLEGGARSPAPARQYILQSSS